MTQQAQETQGADSKKGWWFVGNGSFVSNGYVVYVNGLDGEDPNPIANGSGAKMRNNLVGGPEDSKRRSLSAFISTLTAIADASAASEKKYLEMKLQQLYDSNKSGAEVKYLDKIAEAIRGQDYSAAYTLLLKRQKDLKKFRQEIQNVSHRSYAKSREFFNSQFSKFLAGKFEQQLKNQRGYERSITLDTDFDALIDEFFSDFLNVNIDDNESIEILKQSFINDLENIRRSSGGQIILGTKLNKENGKITGARALEDSAVIQTINKKTKKTKITRITPKNLSGNGNKPLTTKQGKYRSPRRIAEAWAAGLARYVGLGLGQEAYQIGAFQGIGARAFSTGKVTRVKQDYFGNTLGNLQQKGDILVVECYSGTANIDEIINRVQDQVGNQTSAEYFDALDQALKEAAENDPTSEIFELTVNVKGYISNYDLQIEGEGSFANRLGVLKAANVNGIGEQLIFLLNNTAEGALMSGRAADLQDYIAAVCVAWMWDKPEELFNLNLNSVSNFHKVRLFNSGGAYFTASQIIYQTIAKLQAKINDQFVRVNITPPPGYGNYSNLLNNPSNNGVNSWNEWQANLTTRWDEVKRDAMNNGSLSIKFNQASLNQLLSNLTTILNAK